MGDKRSFSDAFAPGKPQGKNGFAPGKATPAAKPLAKAPVVDAFKPAPKPKPEIAKPAITTAVKKKPAAKMQRPPAPPKAAPPPRHEVALKPVQQPHVKLPPLARTTEQPAPKVAPLMVQPAVAKQPAMVRGEPVAKPRNLFGRSGAAPRARQRALTPAGAPKVSALTPAPGQAGGKLPAMVLATAGGALPKPRSGAIYNPFDRKRFVQSPPPAVEDVVVAQESTPVLASDPLLDTQAQSAPTPPEPTPPEPTPPEPIQAEPMLAEPSRAEPTQAAPAPAEQPPEQPAAASEPRRALHVVPSAVAAEPASKPMAAKSGAATRPTSLVLVSGAGALAAEAAEAPEAPEAPPADTPPEAAPVAAEPAPAAASETVKRGGGDGGGAGGGDGGGDGPRAPLRPARAVAHRGFNQDDIFGVVFGIAVIAFMLLWFMRGKGEETLEDGTLFAAQSAPVQRLAVSPTPPVPAPLPPPDPFGQGPVDLKPQGPIPEAAPPPPEAAPESMEVAPATPPPVAAKPAPAIVESTLPLAERKMHAWFCTASSRLTKASRTELSSELNKFATLFAGKELVVRGYADTRGSTEYNSALSDSRASVVADFLRTKGLTVTDFTGVGELDGLDDNQNCANQRRVDVWVKGGPAEAPSRACAPEPDVESLVCG